MNKFKAYRIHSNPNEIHSGFEMLELNDLTSGNVIIKSIYSSISKFANSTFVRKEKIVS